MLTTACVPSLILAWGQTVMERGNERKGEGERESKSKKKERRREKIEIERSQRV